MMHVVIASGGSGGPATHAAFLEKELPQHDISVHTVSFADVRELPPLIRHIWYGVLLHRAASESDLLYVLDPVSVGVPACIVAALMKKKFILRVGGDYAWEQGVQRFGVRYNLDTFIHRRAYNPFVGLLRMMQNGVARRACRVIVPSEYLKEVVRTWSVTPSSISVVYSVTRTPHISGTREVLKSVMQYDGKLIISAGRLVPWKQFSDLVRAMPTILKKAPNTKLIIAGDGPERTRIEKTIAECSLEGVVELTGRLDAEVLHSYIAAADVYVQNSSYEGLPHQLLEVMQLGTPIVATRAGGTPELVRDGKNGTLVSVGDSKALAAAITRTLTDTAYAQKITTEAKRMPQQFTPGAAVKRILETLRICTS